MLLGLLSGIVGGNALSATEAGLGDVLRRVYVLMSLGAFGMVVLLSRAGFEAGESRISGAEYAQPVVPFIMLL